MENKLYFSFYHSPIGYLKLVADEQFLLSIHLVSKKGVENSSFLLDLCKTQLEEYFKGKRKEFDIPIKLEGTLFQKDVWHALLKIPYGKTVSYSDVANFIQRPNAVRAVGGAIHNNPLFLVVPCHRVIGKNGNLTGFLYGISKKQYLLDLEKNVTKE